MVHDSQSPESLLQRSIIHINWDTKILIKDSGFLDVLVDFIDAKAEIPGVQKHEDELSMFKKSRRP